MLPEGRHRTWFSWAVFACGVVPHVVYWGGGAVFGVVAIVRLAHGESAPPSDSIMQTHENWPPVILPSWPFWIAAPALVVGVIRSLDIRGISRTNSLQPWLVSSFALFAGADALLMAIAYLETPEWPRDSLVPGAVLTLTGLVGLGAVVVKRAKARIRLNQRTRANLVERDHHEVTS
jgi:hypothetical protein